MQTSSSISNFTGYFSMPSSSSRSPEVMWMQLAGQAVEHIMHATQRTDPSSRFISLCTPRKRSG